MAQILPDTGLDNILTVVPKGSATIATMYLGLFSSQTASTVITHTQTGTNITESAWTNYARQALAAATWGALAEYSSTLGRITTYPQVSFPACGVTGGTVNGFTIVITNAAPGATNMLGQANFDDATAVVLAQNDIIRVTPSLVLLH